MFGYRSVVCACVLDRLEVTKSLVEDLIGAGASLASSAGVVEDALALGLGYLAVVQVSEHGLSFSGLLFRLLLEHLFLLFIYKLRT